MARDREHLVHRRFELELPVSAVGLHSKQPDAGEVDGVIVVNPNESEGLEQRCDLANRPDIHERCARTQADFGFPTPGSQVVDVIRVEHEVLTAGDVNADSMRNHTGFVARPGHQAHRLAVHRTGWSGGVRTGIQTPGLTRGQTSRSDTARRPKLGSPGGPSQWGQAFSGLSW